MVSTSDAGNSTTSIAPEFVVGITGHRDLSGEEKDRVRENLRLVLSELSRRFRHAPVRIATGLAEGADTIAAEVALELGLGVNAILPMPLDHYEADFEGEALKRLGTLVADERVRVHEIPVSDGIESGDLKNPETRDLQYKLLADYLTRRSNVLLAIWDGENTGLPGGTSDVVLRYLADGRAEQPNAVGEDTEAESCGNLLIWLPARREGRKAEIPEDTFRFLVSNGNYDCYWQAPAIPDHILTRWDGFDAYAADRLSLLGTDLPAYGLSEAGDSDVSPEPLGLDQEYIRADQMARAFQLQSDRMFATFGLIAAAMGLAFLVYAKLLAAKAFLVIYILLFVAGFMGFRYSAKRHLHSKHLAYRALAETYRVQFFLILSGAGAGYQLRRILGLTSVDQFQRFEWLQEAVRCCEPLVYFGHCTKTDALDTVRRRWIEDQTAYFSKKLHRLHAQHHRLETIKSALLVGSVIGALALIFFKKALLHLDMMGYDGKAWLVFLMGLLPLWAAVWELYQGKMATRELLWQYSNQGRYFRAASREIAQAPTLADGQKIIRDLADKALIEIYLWSVHRYHREHEPPAAG